MDGRSEKKKHLLISQQAICPFSRLQTMVIRFVKVVAAKMTDVDRLTMQRKGTSLGDRSDWEDENRNVSGYTWSLAQGTEETVDPLSEIRAPQEHLPVP